MRVSGLATGMDIDTIVKDSMKPYRMKVDKVQQDNDVYAMKQQLYRDVLKDSKEFYSKHLEAKKDSLLLASNWEAVKFSSSNESAVTMKGTAGAIAENYTIDIKKLATSANATLTDVELGSTDTIDIVVNVGGVDKTINVKTAKDDGSGTKSSKELVEELNTNLKASGSDITAKYSEFSKGISLETKTLGVAASFTVALKNIPVKVAKGIDAEVTITNSKGEVYSHTGDSNFLRLDGVEFTFTAKTDAANPIKVTGKNDVTALKDKIVGFVNDYNKLLEGISTKLYEKRDKKYMPLTPEQRKAMSEDEVKLWEGKVKEGQLRKDSDLERLVGAIKGALSPLMGKLEKMGIKPIKNYADKNGILVIDEFKLVAALENDATGVKDVFSKPPSDNKTKDGGILNSLQDVFNEQINSVTAPLIKKVGLEGSLTNEYSKIMDKKKIQIAEMEKQLVQKENDLYLKYSRLESQMAKLNSQSAYLSKQFGA
ncbi:flagellar filament capping protein FliD [Clostridium gasigenes]|uniref:Flagellar hook-associated protein 2 n=1 Tax=Clostridium gasigenes TaxID=94869 RepID=A0A1H0UTW3_9CLOT|nr:flagellar filament capping protein FliD [Clostridium gasigenes]SDP69583.1 flagellar hook-associated protein 2 [Clostridium gasigenes]